jgi:hypothetical protein
MKIRSESVSQKPSLTKFTALFSGGVHKKYRKRKCEAPALSWGLGLRSLIRAEVPGGQSLQFASIKRN